MTWEGYPCEGPDLLEARQEAEWAEHLVEQEYEAHLAEQMEAEHRQYLLQRLVAVLAGHVERMGHLVWRSGGRRTCCWPPAHAGQA